MKLHLLSLAALQLFAGAIHAAGFLHADGQNIVDESEQKVMLRGVGLGNWLLPEGYMWRLEHGVDRPRRIEKLVSDLIGPDEAAAFWRAYRQNYVTEADIARIAELGFNSVRPALNARMFLTEGENPQRVEEGYAILDNLVSWAGKHGIYVIIDMHAAPGGQTGQNIDDSADDQPRLWMDPANQERLVNLWVDLAKRYANNPAVAGYDLLNEPLPRRTGAEDKFKAQLQPMYQRLAQAIRAVDTKHFLTVEGADWANDWTSFTPPAFDKNLVYQFHYYCWDNPVKVKGINQYLDFRDKVDAPVWVGETGEANDTIYWATTELFESKNIGWSFWPWKKISARNGPYSIKPPESWDQIIAYSRGEAKPSPEIARRAFAELLENIKIANCVYHEDVVNSMLRRAPVRIEAENFGRDGLNQSYFVKHPEQRMLRYRTSEPVRIEGTSEGDGRRGGGGQAIRLETGEWTAYTVNSVNEREYKNLKLHARSETADFANLDVIINGVSEDITVLNNNWEDYGFRPVTLHAGANRIQIRVKAGVAGIDWLSVE